MNKLKKVLSKNPIYTIVFLITSFILLSAFFSTPSYELKVLILLLSGINITWFFSTGDYSALKYFISIIAIVAFTSILTGHLETLMPGITGVFFPASLFLYLFSNTLIEFIYPKYSPKHISLMILMFSYFMILTSIFTFVNIKFIYLPLIIAVTVSLLFAVFLFVLKEKRKD